MNILFEGTPFIFTAISFLFLILYAATVHPLLFIGAGFVSCGVTCLLLSEGARRMERSHHTQNADEVAA